MSRTTLIVAAILVVGAAGWLLAASAEETRTTTAAADRYELIQSAGTPSVVVRIDKYTGETRRIVERSGNLAWEPVRWERAPSGDGITPGQVNFQASAFQGSAGRAFIWNINTGEAWHVHFASQRADPTWRRVEG